MDNTNLQKLKDAIKSNQSIHEVAHAVASTDKCLFSTFGVYRGDIKCKRQGVGDYKERYFICRKCIKKWLGVEEK